jgi:hypothetical protein
LVELEDYLVLGYGCTNTRRDLLVKEDSVKRLTIVSLLLSAACLGAQPRIGLATIALSMSEDYAFDAITPVIELSLESQDWELLATAGAMLIPTNSYDAFGDLIGSSYDYAPVASLGLSYLFGSSAHGMRFPLGADIRGHYRSRVPGEPWRHSAPISAPERVSLSAALRFASRPWRGWPRWMRMGRSAASWIGTRWE